MASHAGLILIFKNKEGYVDKEGNITTDKSKARQVTFYEAGFSEPKKVLHKLGLDKGNIDLESLCLETLIPSYDSRLMDIEELLQEMGYSYYNAVKQAEYFFNLYGLSNYEQFKQFYHQLKDEVKRKYLEQDISEAIEINGVTTPLHIVNNPYSYQREGYQKQKFYSEIGEIHKYSISLKNPHVECFFEFSKEEEKYYNEWQNIGLIEKIRKILEEYTEKEESIDIKSIQLVNNSLNVYADYIPVSLTNLLNETVRDHYAEREMHITRMFGSYIIIQRINGKLKAVKATKVPIKYCPLMIKLLNEVGQDKSNDLIEAIKNGDEKSSALLMCKLIDEVVIACGYFDTNRPLNSCEANVLFGASETISSAFKNDLLDAAVIVSNNLGTIITTNSSNTQGAVKRMTGLFYTSPSKSIMEEAKKSKIIPIFPYTAEIDQIAGLKEVIRLGYKKIAVTFAARDNKLLQYVKELEKDGITIYKFGLCSTGIDEKTAEIMKENADIIWSCASKYVKEIIEPSAIAQVGIKIPVHIMTKKGWELVKNHLNLINENNDFDDVSLTTGEDKPVLLNNSSSIKKLTKKEIHKCLDCPSPCI